MKKRCMGCMHVYSEGYDVCPHCGYVDGTQAEEAVYMQPGTLLHDRYIMGKVIGSGGFGTTYIGWDGKLEQRVAIKEYLPSEFSTRMPGRSMITVMSGEKAEQFHSGLEKFIDEAKRLAGFQNEAGIVRVFDSFEENGTAYIVMEYLDGETLTSWLEHEGIIDEDTAVEMLMPVMETLKIVHEKGIIHRDIAPDNIFITKSGEVKLIDFGAARFATTTHSRSLSVIIKQGYSPEEQYNSRGDQGPWTDVYAVGAVLYKMITGKTPPDALDRRAAIETKKKDILVNPCNLTKGLSEVREVALLNALNIQYNDRTPNMQTLIQELNADKPAKLLKNRIRRIDLYRMPLWSKILVSVLLAGVVTFGVLLLTGVIQFASLFSDELVCPDGFVVVPGVMEKEPEEAQEILGEAQLQLNIIGVENYERLEDGIVIYQSPLEEAWLEINSNVNVKLNVGSLEITEGFMPYVLYYGSAEAEQRIQEAGLTDIKLNITEEYSDTVGAGLVLSQNPAQGTKADEIPVINLVISKGTEPIELTVDVAGQSEKEAKNALEAIGLIVQTQYDYSDEVDEGYVIAQSVAKGELVVKGETKIVITVSKGEEASDESALVEVPDVVGKTQTEAVKLLEEAGFKVQVSGEYSDTVKKDTIIRQAQSGKQEKGSAIVIYVSKGKDNTEQIESQSAADKETVSQTQQQTEVQQQTTAEQTEAPVTQAPVLNQFTVSFNGNGGNASEESRVITEGNAVGNLPTASRGTYTFDGWYTAANGGNRISSSTVVTGNVTFYAHWSKNRVTITFNANGGTASESSRSVDEGGTLGDLPTATRETYTFVGWYTAASGGSRISASAIVSDNQTYYAHWSKNAVTVTFDGNGGNASESSRTVDEGETVGTLPTASRSNYTFDGWYTAKEGGTQIGTSSKITADVTYYAHWTVNQYTLSFNANGGTVSTSSKKVDYGAAYGTLPTPARDYYTFDGWYTSLSGGTQVTASTTMEGSNVTVYAHWTANAYTLVFNANGGTISTSSKTVSYGSAYGTLPTPTRDYYTFNGWYTSSSGGTQVTASTTMGGGNVTVYAHWTANTYTLTFNANGGSVSTSSKIISYSAAYGTLPTPTRDYYTFNGWYTSSSGGTQVTASTIMGGSNVTVYAHWELKPESDWVLASNVPSGAQITQTQWTYTRTQTKESTNSSESGWTQTGSYWSQTGSGSTYYAAFPTGYDTSNTYYTSFSKSAYSSYDNGSTKREVSNAWAGYIYWHWMYDCGNANGISTRAIYYKYGYGPDNGYLYKYFYAFTSTNGNYSSDMYYCNSQLMTNYIIPERTAYSLCGGATRWFRFDYYTSTYTDYQKIYQYKKVTNNIVSSTEVTAGGEISNVQKYVKYREK